MPTISNLQGNLRLNSGVFEIVQGTGIIPKLYTSSSVAPVGITTGLSSKINTLTTPWSLITGYDLGLKFASDFDLRYHLQNQYWLFLTGQSPTGPFSVYSGIEGIQSNSTGLNLLRNNLPATFYPKVLVLPLDIESKLNKMFNSGSYGLSQNDKINFGIVDSPLEKINVSGNIYLRSPDSSRYIRFSTKNGGMVDFAINSDPSKKSLPNVTIGQGNYVEYTTPDAYGKYPDSNYLIGKDNVIYSSGNTLGTPSALSIYGIQNLASGCIDAQVFGNQNKLLSGRGYTVNGAYNKLTQCADVVVYGRNTNITNGKNVVAVGNSNTTPTNAKSLMDVVLLGSSNKLDCPISAQPLNHDTIILIGTDQYIYGSGAANISLIGKRNSILSLTGNKALDVSNISIYGSFNNLSGQNLNSDILGDYNLNINSFNNTLLGDANSNSGIFNTSSLGSNNYTSSVDKLSSLGNDNIAYNINDFLILGKLNQVGPGTESKGFSIRSGVLIRAEDIKNYNLSGGIILGQNNKHGISQSTTIGVSNRNYPSHGTIDSGSHSFILGNYNTSSGARNIVIGAFSAITGDVYTPNSSNISLGYENQLRYSQNSVVIGAQNSISSTSGAGHVQNNSNFVLGTNNYFRNSSNNLAIGVGNYFFNETGKVKISLPDGAHMTLTKSSVDFGEAIIKASNIRVDNPVAVTSSSLDASSTINVADSLNAVAQSRLLRRFDGTDSSIFATAISGSGIASTKYSLSNRIYNDAFKTMKMPAQIEFCGCAGLTGTIATGIYDLYYLPTYGKFTGLGAVNSVTPTTGIPYNDFVNGKAPFVEIRRASAVYDYIKKENITYGHPWKESYPYYFYAKFEAPNKYAIISYTSAFTSGITSYNSGDSNYTGQCAKFLGLWALYTGTGYQHNTYNVNNKPVLINTYRSGQFSGWKYGDLSYLNPNEIPLEDWYGSGSWIQSGVGQKLISGFGVFPTAPIGNTPVNLKPVVDLKRIRFMSIALGYENTLDNIPGAFIPIYY